MITLLLTLSVIFTSIFGAVIKDEITNLPNVNFQINFKQYSGYLSSSSTKKLHYWFTESQSNPKTDPVILWLNGGPGCSSLIGLLTELGPFYVAEGDVLQKNEFSWNKIANVIFLESPAGVGYSYDTVGNLTADDYTTAYHNHQVLIDFFNKYPEYRQNDFYIAGESYAGIYIPMLAVKVLEDTVNFPNFKGVMIGNGWLDQDLDFQTRIQFMYYHGIINTDIYNNVINNCCNGRIELCTYKHTNPTYVCDLLISDIDKRFSNAYNIYNDGYLYKTLSKKSINRLKFSSTRSSTYSSTNLPPTNPLPYIRREDVRSALHIPDNVQEFLPCSGIPYEMKVKNVKNEYLKLINSGTRILTYNGDVDSMCNLMGNQKFIDGLGINVSEPYSSIKWTYDDQTIGGYWTKYGEYLYFVTVRGSGHMVPGDKPEAALQMIYNFIKELDFSVPIPDLDSNNEHKHSYR